MIYNPIKSTHLLVITAGFILCASFQMSLLSNSVSAFVYEDPVFNYSFSLPSDWVQIDQSILDSSLNEKYNAGYRKKQNSKFIYPYMLIDKEAIQTTFGKLAESCRNISEAAASASAPFVNGAKFNAPIVDEKNNRILLHSVFSVEQVGKVKGLTSIFLGKIGIVRLYFYSLEEEFETDLPVFTSIIDSQRFRKGYEADDNLGSIKTYDRHSLIYVIGRMAFGAVIGSGVCILIAYFLRKRKMRKRGMSLNN